MTASVEWSAVARRSSYNADIVEQCDRLADAAKAGDWDRVFAVLDAPVGLTAVALANRSRIGGTSGFAPLHQAAWHGANVAVVDRLARAGAWRTLPTTSGETPAAVAGRRGHVHLDDALRPRIRTPLPAGDLTGIEQHFHALVLRRAGELGGDRALRMPPVAPLTELAPGTECWCPVPGMYGGFLYRLDGAALVASSWSRVWDDVVRVHRVTAQGVEELPDEV